MRCARTAERSGAPGTAAAAAPHRPGAAGAAQLARSPPSEPAEVSGWLRGGKEWGGEPCGFIRFLGSPTLCGFFLGGAGGSGGGRRGEHSALHP